MSRIRRPASALALAAIAALVTATLFPSFAGTPSVLAATGKTKNLKAAPQVARTPGVVGTAAPQARGEVPTIELNVDSTSPDASISVVSYTFTGGIPAKFAFGNRFTLSNDQAPFRLEAVAAILTETTENEGFQVGEPIGIVVFVDAASTGDISKAIPVFQGESTVQRTDGFSVYGLPSPIVVQQGDIYIVIVDLTTDDHATLLPFVDQNEGGNADPRSFVATSVGTADQGSAYIMANELPLGDGNFAGNFIIRGLGDPAEATDNVTGGGETVDTTLPAPSNLSALGSGQVTIGFTAPTLPPPPAPTDVAETEPNDSPATAQQIDTNVEVSGSANSGQPGADGGFGGDDVEDWYGFTLAQATAITIDLEGFGNTDFDLILYTVDGPFVTDDAVAISGGGAGEEEHITLDNLAAGSYVIAVTAFDPDVPNNTNYTLRVVAAPKVSRYNVYCGSSEGFAISADTFIGSIPGDRTNLTINESATGAYYKVTAVVGSSQSGPSNAATGEPCEGGPTFTSVKVKRSGPGSITLKGGTGDLTGVTIEINGVGFTKAPKVKASKHQVKQKGPLASGQTVGEACPAGCTITIRTAAGCSTVIAP